jgi:hypothetical protein
MCLQVILAILRCARLLALNLRRLALYLRCLILLALALALALLWPLLLMLLALRSSAVPFSGSSEPLGFDWFVIVSLPNFYLACSRLYPISVEQRCCLTRGIHIETRHIMTQQGLGLKSRLSCLTLLGWSYRKPIPPVKKPRCADDGC